MDLEIDKIPGMIESIEQALLKRLAKESTFESNEVAVEFGTFFGKSTACISKGLSENESFHRNKGKLIAYDSFDCKKDGGFFKYVHAYAKAANKTHLLEVKDSKIDFHRVFNFYLQEHIDSGLLQVERVELTKSFHQGGRIRIMHIDSPKFYREFKFILFRFFPYLSENAYVIFQDFFYHWSASLIAICALLLRKEYLKIDQSAASSLVCKVNKPIKMDAIYELDLALEIEAEIPNLIDYAINSVKAITVDRREIFQPRLTLAKIQWLFESGQHVKVSDEIVEFFRQGNRLNSSVLNDYIELVRNGFSIRKLYNQDHN
jgi:hypothetical protein